MSDVCVCMFVCIPLQNLEHALHTLYTQFAFVLHSFCALVNHILHMCPILHFGHMRRRFNMQYVCSLRTILKICAKYAQSAHYPQDMRKICVICAHKKKKVQHRLLVTHPSTEQAQCCLTSVIGREPVLSMWYGLRQQ